jgi:kynureninase
MSLPEDAAALDERDPLGGKRAEFDLDPQLSYLDGNSLGAPPCEVAARLDEVVRKQWAGRLIRAWDEGWWAAPERIGDRIAPLIGAAPGQVLVGDSTSVTLFKGLAEAVTERTAAALLNHVDYRSGRLHDLPGITDRLHAAGALAVWDLCHSVGAVPVPLDAAGVDVAVGCTYKFLNGGPGSPAFLYVQSRWQRCFDQPLTGWAGHAEPFAMRQGYAGGQGISRARTGTPDILSMLALDAALDVWDGVTIEEVRAKGLALGDFFFRCLDELVPGARVLTPRDHARGNQISVHWPDAGKVMAGLTERGVIGDFRPPDVLRFGLAGLYVRYRDVLRVAEELSRWPG